METVDNAPVCMSCKVVRDHGRIIIAHHFGADCAEKKGPLSVDCPACGSLRGIRCTVPTVDGRKSTSMVHTAREDLANGWT